MRHLIAMSVMLCVAFGLAVGGEFGAKISKIDGDKVTFTKVKRGEKAGEEMTLSAKDAKVVKGKFNAETKKLEAGDALEGGLKNEAVKAGAFVVIVTDADDKNITEIRVGQGFRKKNKD